MCHSASSVGIGSTKSATSLLLSDSRHPALSFIFLITSISLAETILSLLLFYQATMGARTLVSPRKRKLSRRGALLAPSANPCSLSSLIHYCLFSNLRHIVSSKFFDTQAPSISTEELVLPRHARRVLSSLRCNGHSQVLSCYLSRIGRIENPSCSACGHSFQDTSDLILYRSATDSTPLALCRLSGSLRPLVQALESFPASGASWFSGMPPFLGRVG